MEALQDANPSRPSVNPQLTTPFGQGEALQLAHKPFPFSQISAPTSPDIADFSRRRLNELRRRRGDDLPLWGFFAPHDPQLRRLVNQFSVGRFGRFVASSRDKGAADHVHHMGPKFRNHSRGHAMKRDRLAGFRFPHCHPHSPSHVAASCRPPS
jgi:hypothetical protein